METRCRGTPDTVDAWVNASLRSRYAAVVAEALPDELIDLIETIGAARERRSPN